MQPVPIAYSTLYMTRHENLVHARHCVEQMSKVEPVYFFVDIICEENQMGLAGIYASNIHKMVHDYNTINCDHVFIAATTDPLFRLSQIEMQKLVGEIGFHKVDIKKRDDE